MNDTLKKIRWAIGINGAVSVAFGVTILVWPNISLYALTILFGAYAMATGIVNLVSASQVKEGRGWAIASGLLGVGVGVVVLLWPSISALSLLYVIGAYAILLGFSVIGAAVWLPIRDSDSALMTVGGLLSIVFGVVMFVKPGDGALVLLALIATFSLVVGFTQLIVAIGGERIVKHDLHHIGGAAA
jgi:uncharacterized membrane protein HdeD (DUF308 family)